MAPYGRPRTNNSARPTASGDKCAHYREEIASAGVQVMLPAYHRAHRVAGAARNPAVRGDSVERSGGRRRLYAARLRKARLPGGFYASGAVPGSRWGWLARTETHYSRKLCTRCRVDSPAAPLRGNFASFKLAQHGLFSSRFRFRSSVIGHRLSFVVWTNV